MIPELYESWIVTLPVPTGVVIGAVVCGSRSSPNMVPPLDENILGKKSLYDSVRCCAIPPLLFLFVMGFLV
jgi:hypothetical protein